MVAKDLVDQHAVLWSRNSYCCWGDSYRPSWVLGTPFCRRAFTFAACRASVRIAELAVPVWNILALGHSCRCHPKVLGVHIAPQFFFD